ncbi:MAG: hypothetical protein SGPRY_012679, partial [Prymnesium sp.]
YDPVGNYERVRVSVTGSGESLIQPLLDNQLERQHQSLGAKPPVLSCDLTLEQTVTLVKAGLLSTTAHAHNAAPSLHPCPPPGLLSVYTLALDAFVSASERDIRTGDAVEICVITKEGTKFETFPLNID